MFSSKTDLWSTPQSFYDNLNKEFNFTLDPCATKDNHKCDKFYTKEDDGLSKAGLVKVYFAILLMAEKLNIGLRNAIWNQCRRIL